MDLLPFDPNFCGFWISLVSDLGLVVVDAHLVVFISFSIDSNLFSISSQIFAILSIFSSKIWVQTCISLLSKLGSFNCNSELQWPLLPWFSELTLDKVILFGVSIWVLLTSLSGDGLSSLLDLPFLSFPISLSRKGWFCWVKSLNLYRSTL